MNHPLDNCLREIEWLRAEWAKSKNRIEALEKALRKVAASEYMPPEKLSEIAIAALASEQEK